MATTATERPTTLRLAGRGLMWVWLLLGLFPLFFMVVTSLKPEGAARTRPVQWFFMPTLENYANVLSGGAGTSVGFDRLLFNSAAVTLGSTILTVAVALPAAYALSQPTFRARKRLSSWILSTYMFPPIVAVIPVFILAGQVGLIDTYPVLIVPYAAFNLPIAVWILRSTIQQIPYELQEAAMMDGASRFTVMRQIIWPLVVPAVATASILSAVLSWNEFLFSLSLTRAAAKTSPVGIQEFTGMFGTQWGSLTAGGTLIVAPILVLTLILRRRIVSGLTFGAVK
ncbi:carbohydrate ABC transporter permease [Cellulomonas fimi]|uniref:Carbohydrate ABC transporter permease n=1 Tax=Cellulomonas fimi TaxID=1708 RepID=A0A7Y0QJL7_CELFI|nr:carbohydrate ABC transporter permease [Cellulomonas fimi]NMR21482.1 carbohydrate ABC transporter permease [Cellulomonas fimi]